MGGALKGRRWLRWVVGILAVYGGLWAATAVWAPDALRAWDHRRHVEYCTQQGWDPSGGQRQLRSFSVPAPFVAGATWHSESWGPDGQLGSMSEGDVQAIWAFGWLCVFRDQMHWVACR